MCLRISLIMGTVLSVSSLSLAAQQQKTAPPSQSLTVSKSKNKEPESPSKGRKPSISPEGLATVTEILNKCAQVDRVNSGFYAKFLTVVLSGNSPSAIKADEDKPGYESERKLIDRVLSATPATNMVKSCRTIVP